MYSPKDLAFLRMPFLGLAFGICNDECSSKFKGFLNTGKTADEDWNGLLKNNEKINVYILLSTSNKLYKSE